MENSITETIGCDLGDKTSEVCVLRADGTMQRATVRSTRAAMRLFFTRAPAHVVMEVGGHSRWASALLTDLGHRVTVANARRVQLISQSNNKTDQNDAELLARLGRADIGPAVAGRAPEARDAGAPGGREGARRAGGDTHAAGEPRAGHGQELRRSHPEVSRGDVRASHARPRARVAQACARSDLRERSKQSRRRFASTTRRSTGSRKRLPDVAAVSQVTGIGNLTGLVYVLTLEDKHRFTKSRMVGAYLGLRPRKSMSGSDDPQLRITKAGDPFLRRLLVNGAHYVMGPFGPDTDLRRWGLELAKRGGKNAKKRAVIAVARKLAVLLHRLWVTGEVYEPTGYHARQLETRAA